MIEFIPIGMVVGIPVGYGFFLLARRKGRAAKAWGYSMWSLAALWIAGAAALPSMAGIAQDRAAAMPVLFLMAGCFLLQVVMLFILLVSVGPGKGAEATSKKRVVVLLAVLGVVLALSLFFAFVL